MTHLDPDLRDAPGYSISRIKKVRMRCRAEGMVKLTEAWLLTKFKMAIGTVRPRSGLRTPLVEFPTVHSRPPEGAGMTAAAFPVPVVQGAGSRWGEMYTEAGSRQEPWIEWEVRPSGPGLEFASDAAGPP